MLDKLYGLPTETLAVLAAVVFVGYSWIGCFLLRPVFRMFVRSRGGENEIVGYVLSAFGVFYGLLLGLIAVAAYQNLSEVQSIAADEASTLLALYRDASDYPPPLRGPLQDALREYCRFGIEQEWPEQRKGIVPMGAAAKLAPIREALLAFEPQSQRDQIVMTTSFEHFERLSEYGRHRRYAAQDGIPAVMWYVVIIGAVINIGLVWLFEMRFVAQLFLGGLLAFFLGALILLIAVMDHPYRSKEVGVAPKALQFVQQVMTADTGDGSGQVAGEEDD